MLKHIILTIWIHTVLYGLILTEAVNLSLDSITRSSHMECFTSKKHFYVRKSSMSGRKLLPAITIFCMQGIFHYGEAASHMQNEMVYPR